MARPGPRPVMAENLPYGFETDARIFRRNRGAGWLRAQLRGEALDTQGRPSILKGAFACVTGAPGRFGRP